MKSRSMIWKDTSYVDALGHALIQDNEYITMMWTFQLHMVKKILLQFRWVMNLS